PLASGNSVRSDAMLVSGPVQMMVMDRPLDEARVSRIALLAGFPAGLSLGSGKLESPSPSLPLKPVARIGPPNSGSLNPPPTQPLDLWGSPPTRRPLIVVFSQGAWHQTRVMLQISSSW